MNRPLEHQQQLPTIGSQPDRNSNPSGAYREENEKREGEPNEALPASMGETNERLRPTSPQHKSAPSQQSPRSPTSPSRNKKASPRSPQHRPRSGGGSGSNTSSNNSRTRVKCEVTLEEAMEAAAEAAQQQARRRQRHESERNTGTPDEHGGATNPESSTYTPDPTKPQHPFPVESPTQSSSTVPDATTGNNGPSIPSSGPPLRPSGGGGGGGPVEYKIDWRRMWESARSRGSEPSSSTNATGSTPLSYRYTKGPVRMKRKKVVRFTDGSIVAEDSHVSDYVNSDSALDFDDIEEQLQSGFYDEDDEDADAMRYSRAYAAAAAAAAEDGEPASPKADIRITEIRVKTSPNRTLLSYRERTPKASNLHHAATHVQSSTMRWLGIAVLAVIAIIVGTSCGIAGCLDMHSSSGASPSVPLIDPMTGRPVSQIPMLKPTQTILLHEGILGEHATNQSMYQNHGSIQEDGHVAYAAASVAVHEDTMVLGVPRGNESVSIAGAVYVYVRDNAQSEWTFDSKLIPPEKDDDVPTIDGSSLYASFGSSVSLWGNILVVGTDSDETNHDNSTIAPIFVYTRDPDSNMWMLSAQLLDNIPYRKSNNVDGTKSSKRKTAIYESTIVVGSTAAPSDDDNVDDLSNDASVVYVLEQNVITGAWSEVALESPSNDGSGGYDNAFGFSVAVYGDVIVVGAPGRDGVSGSAHVFARQSEGWMEVAKLTQSGEDDPVEIWDQFGFSVAIFDTTIVIGAPSSIRAGSAYVYSFQEDDSSTLGEWMEVSKLSAIESNMTATAGSGSIGYTFGSNVQIWNDTIVVGAAYGVSTSGQGGSGGGGDDNEWMVCTCGYVFLQSVPHSESEEWVENVKLVREGPMMSNYTASNGSTTSGPIAMSGDTIVFGGIGGDSVPTSDGGSVYVYGGY